MFDEQDIDLARLGEQLLVLSAIYEQAARRAESWVRSSAFTHLPPAQSQFSFGKLGKSVVQAMTDQRYVVHILLSRHSARCVRADCSRLA